ncbi:MAG: Zn-dependent protease with chaperone function, partial [Planctomycetota bacterium]
LVLPILMRNTWETLPIPPSPQRSVLERVAERASFRARELLIWRTGNLMANAAIVGVSARSRVVLFSDSLLSVLSLRELASVFGHEMGHALRHHVWIFVAWALAFFLGADQLTQAMALADANPWFTSAALLATLATWALTFGWMSRRFELEADLFSLQLLNDPEGLISALERVGPRERDSSGWRHFSTRRRVDFIIQAAGDPEWAGRFRKRLRVIAITGFVAATIAGGFSIRGLFATLPEDRIWADLSLGHYEVAAARAEREHSSQEDGLDEELLDLARLAKRFASDAQVTATELQVADLEEALARALKGGNLQLALGYSKLAILRGARELHPLSRTLVALMAHDSPAAQENFQGVEAPWRAALTPWASALE